MKRILSAIICFSFFNGLMASSIAPNFASNGMAMYNFNPAFYGILNNKDAMFEVNVQTYYSKSFSGFYWDYPMFSKGGAYGCYGFNESRFRPTMSNQFVSINGKKIFHANQQGKAWILGYGAGLNMENVDIDVKGRHSNIGVSICRMGLKGSFALGLNFKYDIYKARDVSFEKMEIQPNKIDINDNLLNFDFGLRYSNRKENFNVGLSYYNLKSKQLGYIDDQFAGFGGYYRSIVLDYNHYIMFTMCKRSRLSSNAYMNNLFNLSTHQLRSNLWPEAIRYGSNYNYSFKNGIDIGLGIAAQLRNSDVSFVAGGPSFHFNTGSLKLQYTCQYFMESYFSQEDSFLHEIGLSYAILK